MSNTQHTITTAKKKKTTESEPCYSCGTQTSWLPCLLTEDIERHCCQASWLTAVICLVVWVTI